MCFYASETIAGRLLYKTHGKFGSPLEKSLLGKLDKFDRKHNPMVPPAPPAQHIQATDAPSQVGLFREARKRLQIR